MNLLLTIFKLAGSLGLFLYGMKLLSDGLQKSAGKRMKSILSLMTGNRIMSVLTGILITVIIQSSSATTVMVVSFVNASLLNLTQAIGVIMGANIGTTVTGWIVAILGFKMDISLLSLVAIAISLPMMFSKKVRLKEISEIFLGFGILFLGLEYIQKAMPDISGNTGLLSFLSAFNSNSPFALIVCVLIGTLLTIIVQSSSASMAITITMAYQGWIGVYASCALCLGQNIGTTITAYLASLGASTNARRASWAHILFNIIGSLLAMLFFTPLVNLVNIITPGNIHTMTGISLQETLPTFLAMFHTLFNVFNTLLFLPFVNQFTKLVTKLVKDSDEAEGNYNFQYIAQSFVDTPEIYIVTVRGEIGKMSTLCLDMFDTYMSAFARNNVDIAQIVDKLKKQENYADQMQSQLTDFCVKLQQNNAAPTNADTISMFLRVIDELESVTDSIFNLIKLTEQRIKSELSYNEMEEKEVRSLAALVRQFLIFINEHTEKNLTKDEEEYAAVLERSINKQHEVLTERIHARLGEGNVNVQIELMMLEVERNLEHIGDYCINIAQCWR